MSSQALKGETNRACSWSHFQAIWYANEPLLPEIGMLYSRFGALSDRSSRPDVSASKFTCENELPDRKLTFESCRKVVDSNVVDSGDTTPCKVTLVILHGVVSPEPHEG